MTLPLQQFLDWAASMKLLATKGQALFNLNNLFGVNTPMRRLLSTVFDPFWFLKSDVEELAFVFHYEAITQRPRDKQFFFYGGGDSCDDHIDVLTWIDYWKPRTKAIREGITGRRRCIDFSSLNANDRYQLVRLLEDIIAVVDDIHAKVEALPPTPEISSYI